MPMPLDIFSRSTAPNGRVWLNPDLVNNTVPTNLELRAAIERMPVSRIREVANKSMGLADVIPLWFGEPDVETPQFIRDAAVQALADGETFYTPNRCVPELREALAKYNS